MRHVLRSGLRTVAVLGVLAILSVSGRAGVITFDDINTSGGAAQIPTNYQGFTWDSNFYVVNQSYYDGNYGNTYTFPSAPNAAYNAFGVMDVSLSNGAAFNFNGAYFTGWADNNSYASFTSTSITVLGYNGANYVGSASMNLSASGFNWLNANLVGVTNLVFQSSGNSKWWLMDNFTYTKASAVPEPSTVVMAGLGALGLVGFRLRRRAKAV